MVISKCNQHNYFWKCSALVLTIERIKTYPAIPTEMYISEVNEIKNGGWPLSIQIQYSFDKRPKI